MAKKKTTENTPNVHADLKGFDLKLNEFGEIKQTIDIEQINDFLNEYSDDKHIDTTLKKAVDEEK